MSTLSAYDSVGLTATTCDPLQVGTVTDTFTNAAGCDSLVTTVTTLNPSDIINLTATTCDPLQAGTTVDSLTNASGCDSVITTVTTLLPEVTNTVTATTCDPLLAGTTVDTFVAFNTCDSIVTTITTLSAYDSVGLTATTCDPLAVGSVTDTFTNTSGCDSLVTTVTTLNPSDIVNLTATTCDPLQAGTTVDSFTNASGCDSIVTTVTTLLPEVTNTITTTSCDPLQVGTTVDTFVAFNTCDSIVTTIVTLAAYDSTGTTATTCDPLAVGSVTDTFTNTVGCDSLVTTVTTLLFPSNSTVNATSCNPADVGTSIDTLFSAAANGCDSIITTITSLGPLPSNTIFEAICPGDVYVMPNGGVVTTAGTYEDTIAGFNCDSVVTVIITENNSYVSVFSPPVQLCEGQTYTMPNGDIVDATGTYVDTVASPGICGQIVTVEVTVLNAQQGSQLETICFGESFSINGVDFYNTTGTYVDIIPASNGCDSVVTLDLTVLDLLTDTLTTSICFGDSVTINGSDYYTTTGSYFETLQGQGVNCDSIVVLNLTVGNSATYSYSQSICEGDSVSIDGNTYYNTEGSYSATFSNGGSCDSIVTLNLVVNTIKIDTIVTSPANCLGVNGSVLFEFESGVSPFMFDVTDVDGNTLTSMDNPLTGLDAGSYTVLISDSNLCSTDTSFAIDQENSADFEVTPDYSSIIYGDSVEFFVSPANGNITWLSNNFLSCDTCSNVISTPEYSIYYIIQKDDGSGCLAYDTVYIEVKDPEVFIPTAFSPNGDNDNDILYIIDKNIDELIYFRIWNRWGELLFETDDINEGWDGFYKGDEQELDTYVFDAKVIMYTGKTVQVHGQVLLVR
ncbi:MAG: gliding motility-associated C-terminal domain-containing protein [Chitinophagales bacterium]